jgi:hypothetical protein
LINHETIENFLLNNGLESENLKDDECIEEKYFTNINYRKIKKKISGRNSKSKN